MLRLIRIHEKLVHYYSELDNSEGDMYEEVLSWEIGTFETFEDILKYLYNYHGYKVFKKFDEDNMRNYLTNFGHVYVLHNEDEYYMRTEDGCVVNFYVENV
jgi:hypothetical protein